MSERKTLPSADIVTLLRRAAGPRGRIYSLDDMVLAAADEIERLRDELHEAGDGDTWREACKRCEAEIQRLQKLVLGQERCFACKKKTGPSTG